MEQTDVRGKPVPFSFQYAKLDGTLKTYENAVLSSIFSRGATLNVITDGGSTPRTFRKILIMRFNGNKIYI